MTYLTLKNFPQYIIEDLKEQWFKQVFVKEVEVNPGAMIHHSVDEDHHIYDYFPNIVKSIEFYSNPPHSRNGPHLDRGRWCALNVPIDVDFENSFFFLGKEFLLKNYKPKILDKNPYDTNTNHKSEQGPSGFFVEEKEKFFYNNLSQPVLFSTKVPHGCENKSDHVRVICSISFGINKYEEVIHLLPQEWF